MQFKRLLAVFFVLLVLLAVFAAKEVGQAAYAQSLTTNCSADCASTHNWPGTTYGMESQVTLSSPGLSDTNAQFNRNMSLNTNGGNPVVVVGMTKGKGNLGTCGVGLWLFSYVVGSDGVEHSNGCVTVNSTYINDGLFFQINDYTSNGGGNLVQVKAPDGTSLLTAFYPYTDHLNSSYNNIFYSEDIQDHVSGHEVWGSIWTNNQWVQSNGTFVYTTVNGTFSVHSPTPPQMYWFKTPGAPDHDSSGGQMYSCEYDSTSNSCTLGS